MKLSIFYQHITQAAQTHNLSEEEVLKKAYDMGYRGLECEYSLFKDDREAFKKIANDCGFSIVSVPYYGEFNVGIDRDKIEKAVDDVIFMGCKNILSIPGLIDPKSKTYEKELDDIKYGLELLCKIANKKGVTVAMEEYDNIEAPFGTICQVKDFLDSTKHLKFNLDTGNFYTFGEDVFDAIEIFEEKISHVHLKNRRVEPLFEGEEYQLTSKGQKIYPTPVGVGQIDMKAILDKLVDISYDGYFTVEHFGEVDQLDYMEKSAKWFLDLMA